MENGKKILTTLKDYIDTELDPSKGNLHDPKIIENFEDVNCIEDKLNSIQISTAGYKSAFFISENNDFQVHRKPPNSNLFNNYFLKEMVA